MRFRDGQNAPRSKSISLRHRGASEIRGRRNSHRREFESLEHRQLLAGDLIAHWLADRIVPSNDGSIPQWTDTVTNLAAATVGQPMLQPNALAGRALVRFDATDGADGFRVKSTSNPLSGAQDFSVVVAIATDSQNLQGTNGPWFTNTGLVDANALGFSQDWGLAINSTGQISTGMGAGFAQNPTTLYSTATGLNDGQLHVIAMSRQGSSITLRIDDRPADTRTDFNAAARSALDLTLGILQNGDGPYTGQIGQVRLYNGALTSEEATAIVGEIRRYYSNTLPAPSNDSYSLDEDAAFLSVGADEGLLANDTDADGDPMTAVLATPPQHGQLALAADGSFIYTPERNFSGTDSFTYFPQDIQAGPTATVTLEVRPIYDPPQAVADQY
jgi:VCBS repeat-containing protein